jgi:hypothetical protein
VPEEERIFLYDNMTRTSFIKVLDLMADFDPPKKKGVSFFDIFEKSAPEEAERSLVERITDP